MPGKNSIALWLLPDAYCIMDRGRRFSAEQGCILTPGRNDRIVTDRIRKDSAGVL